MSTPKAGGITAPDERSVALVEWSRKNDGSAIIRLDDPTRGYVFVAEPEASRFEDAADLQGWKVAMVGYDDFTERRTYAIIYVPPSEFLALDLTKAKDVRALHRAIVDRPKRFRTTTLRARAESAASVAFEVAIGEMRVAPAEDTVEVGELTSRRRVRGAELASALIKSVTAMEQINQADEHIADKNERIDSGLATDAHAIKTYKLSQEDHDRV